MNKKVCHYTPILYGQTNGRLGKANFHSLRIVMDSRAILSIVLGKHTKKRNQKTYLFKWSTQGGDFQTNHTANIEFILL